jgi:hypothetical protein
LEAALEIWVFEGLALHLGGVPCLGGVFVGEVQRAVERSAFLLADKGKQVALPGGRRLGHLGI